MQSLPVLDHWHVLSIVDVLPGLRSYADGPVCIAEIAESLLTVSAHTVSTLICTSMVDCELSN
jgi:hypothetical protein